MVFSVTPNSAPRKSASTEVMAGEGEHPDPVDPDQPRHRSRRVRGAPATPACQTGFRAGGVAPACAGRDSGSHLQAKTTFTRQSAAATKPGAARPQWAANEPIAGPSITPAEVAAESQPSARARSPGLDGVGHVGLRHAGGAAAGALHDAGEEEQPDRVGQPEHHVGDRRRRPAR